MIVTRNEDNAEDGNRTAEIRWGVSWSIEWIRAHVLFCMGFFFTFHDTLPYLIDQVT